jgi:ABC-type lipoprotein export system ATPase subunit
VILDEPVSNLDHAGKAQVYDLVKSESESKTLIIASNDESDLALCGRVINIEEFKRK